MKTLRASLNGFGYKRLNGLGDPSTDPYDTSYDPVSNPTENESIDPTTGAPVVAAAPTTSVWNTVSNLITSVSKALPAIKSINPSGPTPSGVSTVPTIIAQIPGQSQTQVAPASTALSTGAKVAIGAAALALIGGIVYFVAKPSE